MKMTSSHLLSEAALRAMQIDAKILEQDERGIKVLQLANGNMFKIFKLRGILTSSRVYSNARSFCRNAERLQKLGIPTVKIITLYHFSYTKDTAVMYQPLAGDTIKNIIQHDALADEVCVKLGQFFAHLHQLGIHFRSLHFGNIVLNPSGELGLIDIADMRIYPWRLHFNTRLRALKRLIRYRDDMRLLGKARWQLIMETYVNASDLALKKVKVDALSFPRFD